MTCPSTKLLAALLGVDERQAKQLLDKACPLLQAATIAIPSPELRTAAEALCSCQAAGLARELLEKAAGLLQALARGGEGGKRKKPRPRRKSKTKRKASQRPGKKRRGARKRR